MPFSKLDERELLTNFNKIELSNIDLKYKESNFNIKVDNMVIKNKDKISIVNRYIIKNLLSLQVFYFFYLLYFL